MGDFQQLSIMDSNGIKHCFTSQHRFDFLGHEEIIPKIENRSGLYAVLSVADIKGKNYEIFYIGETGNIPERIEHHDRKEDWKEYHRKKGGDDIVIFVMYADSWSEEQRKRTELSLIRARQPALNVQGKR